MCLPFEGDWAGLKPENETHTEKIDSSPVEVELEA